MAYLPVDVANQALDAAGAGFTLGDLEEGTTRAQVVLRAYGQCLRQLLRAAHWNFARKTAPLTLLADRTGQTPNTPTQVIQPWTYEYSYPTDCMKVRFVPFNACPPGSYIPPDNIQRQGVPPVTGAPPYLRLVPSRFLEAIDYNYPPQSQQEWWEVQGVSPTGRTVICSNVKEAQCVYTAFVPYPTVWDSQFRAAFVAYLASEIALPLAKDVQLGMRLRDEQIKIAMNKIKQARVSDGNEGWPNSDINVDWLDWRGVGARRGAGGDSFSDFGGGGFGGGELLGGYGSIGFSNGSTM